MGKEEKGGNIQDVEVYFNNIKALIRQYRSLVDKLATMTNKKKHAAALPDLLVRMRRYPRPPLRRPAHA
jgi:hypothetical protein